MRITPEQIQQLDQRYRARLINSLGGFKSVVLIGTQNKQTQTNLAIFSSLFHLGANPALCGLIVRPDSAERHTLSNILETGFYTVNHVHEGIYLAAHQTSARYPIEQSEFSATGLKEEWLDAFFAPFVAQSVVKLSMQLEQKIDLTINGTTLLIGKILDVYVPQTSLGEDGFVDLESAGTLALSGLDSYHRTQKLARLAYAKPDTAPRAI